MLLLTLSFLAVAVVAELCNVTVAANLFNESSLVIVTRAFGGTLVVDPVRGVVFQTPCLSSSTCDACVSSGERVEYCAASEWSYSARVTECLPTGVCAHMRNSHARAATDDESTRYARCHADDYLGCSARAPFPRTCTRGTLGSPCFYTFGRENFEGADDVCEPTHVTADGRRRAMACESGRCVVHDAAEPRCEGCRDTERYYCTGERGDSDSQCLLRQAVGGACTSDRACAAPALCIGGRCVVAALREPCALAAGAAPLASSLPPCAAHLYCRAADDAPRDATTGVCVERGLGGGSCDADEQCASRACTLGGHCASTRELALGDACGTSAIDPRCGPFMECVNRTCRPEHFAGAEGAACQAFGCAPPLMCIRSRCVTPPSSDAACYWKAATYARPRCVCLRNGTRALAERVASEALDYSAAEFAVDCARAATDAAHCVSSHADNVACRRSDHGRESRWMECEPCYASIIRLVACELALSDALASITGASCSAQFALAAVRALPSGAPSDNNIDQVDSGDDDAIASTFLSSTTTILIGVGALLLCLLATALILAYFCGSSRRRQRPRSSSHSAASAAAARSARSRGGTFLRSSSKHSGGLRSSGAPLASSEGGSSRGRHNLRASGAPSASEGGSGRAFVLAPPAPPPRPPRPAHQY